MSRAKTGLILGSLVGGVCVIACANDSQDERAHAKDEHNAHVSMALNGHDFTGNSVYIAGARSPAADAKLTCTSNVNVCLNFNADGTTNVLLDLCATDMAGPTGLWSFDYRIYDSPNCTGSVVSNLACGASGPEPLPPGAVTTNTVNCTSENAAKGWDFNIDSGNPDCPDGSTCVSGDQEFQKFVFITSTTSNANLGGLAGADAFCQARATAANLPGTYKAWLSISGNFVAGRFAASTLPYRLVNGALIANDFTDLTDGTIANPINRTEFGALLTPAESWTGTHPNGTFAGPDCSGWTVDTSAQSGMKGQNFSTGTGTEWTETVGVTCDTLNHLYCVQQ